MVVPLVKMIFKYKLPRLVWVPLYAMQIVVMQYIAITTCSVNQLGFASAMVVMCEMVRMGMKMHAYLRNKLLFCNTDYDKFRQYVPPYALKLGITEKNLVDPKITMGDLGTEIKRFMFFFFCPTLIYRDNYIKSPNRNYRKMFEHFFNFLLCIYFGFVLFKTFCKP